MDPQQFYFRQLLSGRDFAVGDQIATQMVNFVYAIGDRATGECVLVDPAYAVDDLLDAVEADDMRCTGVLATHYHPDHFGLAGWLQERTGASLWMARTEYLMACMLTWRETELWLQPSGNAIRSSRPGRRRGLAGGDARTPS